MMITVSPQVSSNIYSLRSILRIELHKHNSSEPDSLGDQLFCTFLNLGWAQYTGEVSEDLLHKAKELVKKTWGPVNWDF